MLLPIFCRPTLTEGKAKMVEQSGNKMTASAARALLCEKDPKFRIVTGQQKSKIVVEFAKGGKVVYGQAFDLVY